MSESDRQPLEAAVTCRTGGLVEVSRQVSVVTVIRCTANLDKMDMEMVEITGCATSIGSNVRFGATLRCLRAAKAGRLRVMHMTSRRGAGHGARRFCARETET